MQHPIQLVNILSAVLLMISAVFRTSGSQAILQFLGGPQFTAHVSLAAPPGSIIYTFLAINSSLSRPDGIRYSLVEQSYDPNLFELHPLTGELVNLQYLPLQSWVLQVKAEAGADSVQTQLTVTAEPEYKVLPVFEKEEFSFTISEYTPVGSLFGIVRAFSLDPTAGAHGYTIISGNAGNDIMINATTGILTVARELDYETTPGYTLTVEYSDGTAEARVSVDVSVLDENDNRPYFPVVIYEAEVSEGAETGSSALTVSAVDLDSTVNGEIEYSIVESDSGFMIDSGSGEVTTAAELDYEEQPEHRFTVLASDGGNPVLTSSVILVVRVVNEDDECPIFQSSYMTVTFPPEAIPAVETVVAVVNAIDPDNFNSITYSLGTHQPQSLSLDATSGEITLLDNSPNKYSLRIFASDAPSCDNGSYVDVVINIGSTNSYTPQFTAPCEGSVSENSLAGTLVTVLQATDEDMGIYGEISYIFLGVNTEFTLDSLTGEVTVSEGGSLDYELKKYYLIDVVARDSSNRQDYCLLNITVLDVNDNAPIFLDYPDIHVGLPENPTVGMFVVQLLAEDADSGSNAVIEYALQGTGDFSIDPSSGVVTVASETLDAEESYSFNVEASNTDSSATLSSAIPVTVAVSSDSIVFNQSLYNATICENILASTPVLQVSIAGSTSTAIYSLISGSQYSSNGEEVFVISPLDGNIRVSSEAIADYEKLRNSKFIFSVRAQGTSGDSIATVEITVLDYDDNEPQFEQDSTAYTVSENAPMGTLVARVSATDPDTGTNGDIVYSISSGSDLFRITDSGEIFTLMEIDAEEMAGLIQLIITANNPNPADPSSCSSDLRHSGATVITVSPLDLNDNTPLFVPSTQHNISLSEDTPLQSLITTFSATDEDVDSELYYSLTGGDTQNFMLMESGDLVLIRPLDFEENPTLVLTIQVSDGMNTNSTQLTIKILDVDDEVPVFTQSSYLANITENQPLRTSVLVVSAEDVDTASISYWLTGTAEGKLSISSTGVITVSGNIDREEFTDGILFFVVVAEGGHLATADITISITDVNDCVPRFSHIDPLVVSENISPGPEGVFVGTVTAYDSDMGTNGEIVYSLRSGGENGFSIDSTTGNITTNMEYDREMTASYTLVVEAMDMGQDVQLSTVATFQVNVGDENDNIPFFPFPYMYTRIFEDSEAETEVFQLLAVDLDEGTNAELTFTLLSSQPASNHVFTLDEKKGMIRLAQTLDFEDQQERSFTLTFSVADSLNAADNHAMLQIEVLDRNDNTPVVEITGMPLGREIPEDTAEGTIILEVTASDGDSGVNGELTFTISGGDPDGNFAIRTSANDANVSIARQLDYEMTKGYNLFLQVCDKGTPSLCSSLTHDIIVMNIDDVAPSFSQPLYRGSVEENSPPVGSILQVQASDPDSGDGFVYAIQSGNIDSRFSINSTTGVLSSTTVLDREEQDTYTLVITAADEGGIPLSGTGTCVITVTDVDDNPPENDSQWNVFMLLLNGYLPDGHTIDYYFNDPDTTSTFSDCITVQSQNIGSHFTPDEPNCRLLLNKGSIPEDDYSIRVRERGYNIFSTVEIDVEHISTSDIPTDYLVTVSLAMSSASYLTNAYTSFPNTLSNMLNIDREMLTIISIQDGYHDSLSTVDVSFFAKSSSNSYIDPALILQTLFTERDRFKSLLGYELSALPTDPCSSEPCARQASCIPTKNVLNSSVTATSGSLVVVAPVIELGYECDCIPGTAGENCSINFNDCYSNPCHFGAQCIDEVNGYECLCPSGTSGDNCSISPNDCSSNPCQNGANCRDIPSSHSCLCLPGYYGPECQYHYFRTAPTCESGPCQNGGTCSPGHDSFTCLCPDTHSGPLCEVQSQPQGCTGNPCYNGSTCIDLESKTVCFCSVGFTGPLCRWQIDNCELEPCLNGGTCATGLYGSYQCYCPSPYTGENCEEFISGCGSSPCLNGGRCSDVSGSSDYTCECRRGYSGHNCEYEVQPVNLCSVENNPCVTGNCTYGLETYTCSCPASYSGDCCEIESPPITQCDSNPCQHGGDCTTMNNDNYICTCSAGFTGANCEIDIDDCSSNPCVNGVCRDGVNGYECECESEQVTGYHCEVWCPSGLSGDFCQVPVSQCDQTLCLNGGTCVEGTDGGGVHCVCPHTHRGPTCEQENTCDAVECFNGGSCIALEGGGFGCVCTSGFEGANCQLLTVSFIASPSGSTYRAYSSLHLSAKGRIEFEFSTVDSNGLLLYNTQLQSGESQDFISVEVEGGQLAVGLSHGEDKVQLVPDLWVSDGQWHQVTIEIIEKTTSVSVDWCHDLDDVTGTSAGCHVSADTRGDSSFLDLGLPLWLGGAPSPSPSHVSSTAITACVRQVVVNGDLLDLNSHIDLSNSQSGCPQLEDQCSVGECGGGDCVATWTRAHCDCPPLLSGDLCDSDAPSLSYVGSGYARFTLTEEGLRQSRQTGGQLRSSYEDTVSLTLRTSHTHGFLFGMYGKDGAEYLYIVLEWSQVVLHLRLSGETTETELVIPSQQLNDSQRHNLVFHRRGAHLNFSVDSNTTLQYSLPPGTPLTLETLSSEIYTGGSPFVPTSSWFTGCLQDVRINQISLPTSSAGNEFASVAYEGSGEEDPGVTEGCSLSPCYLDPCGSSGGMCEETSNESYQCICSGGERVSGGPCPQEQEVVTFLPYVIAGGSVFLLLVVASVSLFACVCICRRKKKKRTYLVREDKEKMGSQELTEFFVPSQALIISNDQGGGEVDASEIDWAPIVTKYESSSQPSKSASSKDSPASKTSQASSRGSSGVKKNEEKYRYKLPMPQEKEEVDGEGEGEEREEDIRPNSPAIRAFLEERVDAANDELLSVDSLRKFEEEGSEDSEVDSLSSAYHSNEDEDDEEGYTLERLQAAGPPLSSLAPLLQHVLHSTAEISTRVSPSSTLDTLPIPYTPPQ